MLAAAIIVASLALIIAVITLIIAGATYTKLSSFGDDQWEDSAALDAIYRQLKQLFRFVKEEYQRAASANGMFREQAAEARTKLSEHMAECHASDPKPEDTPAFTSLIDEQATHKVADLFEAIGFKPEEVSNITDLVEGEVTKIVTNSTGEITEVNGLPVLIAESGPEDIYPDEELPFEDEEDDFTRCERINLGRHRYNEHGRCTECDADAVEQGDADPEDEDELPSEDRPTSQEYEEAVWPGHTERTTL